MWDPTRDRAGHFESVVICVASLSSNLPSVITPSSSSSAVTSNVGTRERNCQAQVQIISFYRVLILIVNQFDCFSFMKRKKFELINLILKYSQIIKGSVHRAARSNIISLSQKIFLSTSWDPDFVPDLYPLMNKGLR